MKNYFEKLKMALWVFAPMVTVLSVYTGYLYAPINKNENAGMTNSYQQAKKTQKSHSFHIDAERNKENAVEM